VVISIPISTAPNDLKPGAYRRRIPKTPRIYGLEVAVGDCAGFMRAFSSASTAPRSASRKHWPNRVFVLFAVSFLGSAKEKVCGCNGGIGIQEELIEERK
jgi:hypothetical protein